MEHPAGGVAPGRQLCYNGHKGDGAMGTLEAAHFYIDGEYGGNQDRLRDPLMRMGGCGALTACDLCIDLALHHGLTALYPGDSHKISRADYARFTRMMKPYLHPRIQGINTTQLWMDGFSAYLQDRGEHRMTLTAMGQTNTPIEVAARAIARQLEADLPVPFLLLRTDRPALKDFNWHWFLLTACRGNGEDMGVQTATYGERQWFPLSHLWYTPYTPKGGAVLLELQK